MTTRVAINGTTLKWAREILGIDAPALGRGLRIPTQKINGFENGDQKPTFLQLVKIAKKLDRPPAFFFVPPPDSPDIPQTVDFRGFRDSEISPQLLREMKRAEAHRRTFLDLSEDNDRPFEFGRITRGNLKERSEQLRQFFEIGIDFLPESRIPNTVWNFWRSMFEQKGILVFQTTRIPLKVFHALTITHSRNPIIIVNGADYPNAKIFSLFHEFAHLANAANGLCALDDSIDAEIVANRFAAEFLMPELQIIEFYESSRAVDRIDSSSKHFRVSKLSLAIRLQGLGKISQAKVNEISNEFDAIRQRELEERESNDFVMQPWKLRYRDLSPRYLETVFHALNNERVNEMDVSYFLDARIPMVEQIKNEFYRRVSS